MKPMNDHAQAPVRIPKPRRDYKDTLFRLLFQDRDRLLSLYNAVNGTSYDSPEELTVVPLENAVYMNMKNDMAFLVDFQLNLYEHQSTWNPNMPLRNLFYAAREYQTLTRDQSLYAPQLVKIPTSVVITVMVFLSFVDVEIDKLNIWGIVLNLRKLKQ